MRAAVLYTALARYRTLVGRPDADQRVVTFLCMVEFVERNEFELDMDDDLAAQLVAVASGLVADIDFAGWLAGHLHPRSR